MTDEGSNTAKNSRKATGKPFVKGDPRINRKGRPRSFDKLRALAQSISHEEAVKRGSDGSRAGEPLIIDGHKATIAEAILRQWASSKSPQLQRAFMEYAYGKVPERTEERAIDWRDEVVALLVSGRITADDVREQFADDPATARELIGRAGLTGKQS